MFKKFYIRKTIC